MAAQVVPTVFLSHSHHDKRVARRLVRFLGAHGVKVWIDERDLRVGATLTPSIGTQIQGADALIVLASTSSVTSKWVGQELDYAREHQETIIPLFIEPVANHERFRDHLGVDATMPQTFADVVHGLMRDLFLSSDLDLPPTDTAVRTAGLRDLAKLEPVLLC